MSTLVASQIQVKGKVVTFNGIEKSKENITILGDKGENLTITFKREDVVESVFEKLGIEITQHIISGTDKAFDVVAFLESEGVIKEVTTFSNGDTLEGLESGELPKVMYRYNNRFGLIQGIEQAINLTEIDTENTSKKDYEELEIITNSGKIVLQITTIKTIEVSDFVENYIKLMMLKAYKYNTPINLDEVFNDLTQQFLLKLKFVND